MSRTVRAFVRAFLVLALAATSVRCAVPERTGGQPCQSDPECPVGDVCANGVCQAATTRDGGPPAADGGEDAGAEPPDAGQVAPDGGLDGGADAGPPGLGLGERCADHAECQSQICLQVGTGSICTRSCTEDCSPDYACKAFVLERNRIVNLCIPFSEVYCRPCAASSECLRPADRCVDLSGATYCLKGCGDTGGACPAGYECRDVPYGQTAEGIAEAPDGGLSPSGPLVIRQCVPVSGKCVGCIDADGDRYGVGADCLGPDCDDHDPSVHPGAPEICDGKDNNCDGNIDEGFDLASDDRNCGVCGRACEAGKRCCAGICADTASSVDHCGRCDNPCTGAEAVCCAGTCRDTRTDTSHCGGCSLACTNEHGGVACTLGQCAPSCASGFGDCDGNARNGCETRTNTTDHCGACEVACRNPHGTTQCAGGVCAPSCELGYGNCDGDPNNGCETDLLYSAENCSRCGIACTNAHGANTCEAGLCHPVCDLGWGDCDGNTRNGCETDLSSSDQHCGQCNRACGLANALSSLCVAGGCRIECKPGFHDCNGDPRDGCEANLAQVNTCNSCQQDVECPPDFFCAAVGICTRKRPRGDDCTAGPPGREGRECLSGFCVDGVCCDTACQETCRSCRLEGTKGTCNFIPRNQDPDNECPQQPPSSCGFDGFCDGAGACQRYGSATVCEAESCIGSTHRLARRCDGTGECVPATATTVDCAPYTCGVDTCKSACQTDADCTAAYTCVGATAGAPGICKLRQGQACGAGSQCASTFCVDGFCCNNPCAGACRACNRPGNVGVCTFFEAGTDPEGDCQDDGRATCRRDGMCDGTGGCRLYAAGTSCVDQRCSGQTLFLAQLCDGTGTCGTPVAVSCAPYACGTDACRTSCTENAHCATGFECKEGQCKLSTGQPCSNGGQCATGHCYDGVCCNADCSGPCRGCAYPSLVGICTFATPGTDPDNDCPTTAPETCGLDGWCGPGGQCRYYGTSTQCGPPSCTGSTLTNTRFCNNAGACVFPVPPGATTECAPYACSQGACKAGCQIDADCVATHTCVPGEGGTPGTCKLRQGQPCTAPSQCANNTCVDGFCCNSPCTGVCRACNRPGREGECSFHPEGSDPEGDCPDDGRAGCKRDGECDAEGACRLYSSSTVCVEQTCTGATQYNEQRCTGAGMCAPGTTTSCFPYRCGATACRTSCSDNTHCVDGYGCSNGKCLKLAGGECSSHTDCQTGHCYDGVCCNEACTGPCRRCDFPGSSGVCAFAPAGTDPDNDCTESSSSSCGLDGLCGPGGQCRYWSSSTQCQGPTCSGAILTHAKFCSGAGACQWPDPPGESSDCSPYVCAQGACKTSCQGDGDCIASHTCAGGTCKLRRGQACTNGAQCATGFCADGVCCDGDCAGPCRSCARSGLEGTCSPHPAGSDPENDCPDDGAQSCRRDGWCDGAGACRYYAGSTVCVAQSCEGATQSNARLCDGAGTCQPGTTTACAPYTCGATGCRTSCTLDSHCVSGYACAGGVCKQARGTSCNSHAQCASNQCWDGVCCDTDCSGTCRRCNFQGSVGTCTFATAGTDPDDDCTASSSSSCGLDGECGPGGACRFWGTTTQCQASSCSGTTQTNTKFCSGSGSCIWPTPPGTTTSCSPYVCGPTSCKTSCNADADCVSTHYCAPPLCVQKKALGATCDGNNQCQSGACCSGVCVDLQTNLNHCGVCGKVCSNAHGTTSCSGGLCQPVCSGLWGNCDGIRENGCETSLETTSNCNGCGITCSRPNATATCAGGTCAIASCNNGWADCDGVSTPTNGCELNLADESWATLYIGGVSGDTGGDTITVNGVGGRWYQVRVREDSNDIIYISAIVELDPPAGMDYDLYVYSACSGSNLGSSTRVGAALRETVGICWHDRTGSFLCAGGCDDSLDVNILVRLRSGNQCSPYTLRVRGNLAVSGCDSACGCGGCPR